ncbi:hypothetical protein SAY86_023058 [Trapa natans]|uniref:Uncharacterized protein n=1 Tax=Trapa natans TaxID=22666 RepID=A0AAN7M6P4_TRANT|nr:hypothetical protein SAY86_023058 [Trapa natans]
MADVSHATNSVILIPPSHDMIWFPTQRTVVFSCPPTSPQHPEKGRRDGVNTALKASRRCPGLLPFLPPSSFRSWFHGSYAFDSDSPQKSPLSQTMCR